MLALVLSESNLDSTFSNLFPFPLFLFPSRNHARVYLEFTESTTNRQGSEEGRAKRERGARKVWNVYTDPLETKGDRKGVRTRPPPIARCSRSGVEHPTDGNVRGNSVQPRAQALPLLSAIFLSLSLPFRIRSLPVSIRLPPSPLPPFDTLYSDLAPLSSAGRATRQLFRISFPP